ncbi:MAG TPA: TIGR03842 family LLM class F420-dependent oxidoreductase [Acidimicrobiales bacterium]|nr:TIGR03842 family LLM class F420-dependent oxidoreductase [Acidimicrobiales bacterium]
MNFGLVLQTDPPASRVVELARRAEGAGFSSVWTFDSPVLWQEPFVVYVRILEATERVTVGTMVTNPRSREWPVTASLFATLNDMFGNRTMCGIGRGDSAVRVLGERPTTLEEVGACIRFVKAVAEGREAELHGTPVRLSWVRDGSLPVWMAAYGPKALEVAGREADGVILQIADPFVISWAVGRARAAAEAAGRDPDALSICAAAPAYVGEDRAHQRDQVRWFGGMVGNHVADLVTRYGQESAAVPVELTAYIERRTGYDYAHHGRAGNPDTEFVPDEIVDRFCVLGTAADHVAKLRELEALGVTQFALYLMHDAQDATLAAYGDQVVPALSGG